MNDEEFAKDVLQFAAWKYHAQGMDNMKVAVEHVKNTSRWSDLGRDSVSKAPSSDRVPPGSRWSDADGWSFVFEKELPDGRLIRTTDSTEKHLIAKEILEDFDPNLAGRAAQHDAVIFLNDTKIEFVSKERQNYKHLVITHEALHMVEDNVKDRTGKGIFKNHQENVLMDRETIETFGEYARDKFRRRPIA